MRVVFTFKFAVADIVGVLDVGTERIEVSGYILAEVVLAAPELECTAGGVCKSCMSRSHNSLRVLRVWRLRLPRSTARDERYGQSSTSNADRVGSARANTIT